MVGDRRRYFRFMSGRVVASAFLGVALAACAAFAAPSGSAAAARCTTSQLVVWLDTQANGAAGSSYYKLRLTNLSARACVLSGYPGVSAVNLAGRQLGRAAGRNPVHPVRPVRLAAGATATAVLQITDVHNYPVTALPGHDRRWSACLPAQPDGIEACPVPIPRL
jgi:hypothetical protein